MKTPNIFRALVFPNILRALLFSNIFRALVFSNIFRALVFRKTETAAASILLSQNAPSQSQKTRSPSSTPKKLYSFSQPGPCGRSCRMYLSMWSVLRLSRGVWNNVKELQNELMFNHNSKALYNNNIWTWPGCDFLVFTGDSGEDENCHLAYGDFTFQVDSFESWLGHLKIHRTMVCFGKLAHG